MFSNSFGSLPDSFVDTQFFAGEDQEQQVDYDTKTNHYDEWRAIL